MTIHNAEFGMTTPLLAAPDFKDPAIILSGTVDYDMYTASASNWPRRPNRGSSWSNSPPWAAIRKWRA